jgi:hypothetical protein
MFDGELIDMHMVMSKINAIYKEMKHITVHKNFDYLHKILTGETIDSVQILFETRQIEIKMMNKMKKKRIWEDNAYIKKNFLKIEENKLYKKIKEKKRLEDQLEEQRVHLLKQRALEIKEANR